MAWTSYQIGLALLMVVTGSLNTLSTKWADNVTSPGSDGKLRPFKHPFVQACFMFLGEMLCLVVFKCIYYYCRRRNDNSEDVNDLVRGNRNFNPFLLFVPAMCDMIGTSTMYVGLNLTFASSFQMFRGSVIVFVGILSVAFLERTLKRREWSGIFFVIIGLAVVGAADFMSSDTSEGYSRNNIITGDLLIILAQIITSVQMVYEEKYVSGLNIPALQAVGWEGFFGFSVLGLLLVPMYYIQVGVPFSTNPDGGSLEDFFDAIAQIGNSSQLGVALTGTVISIAFFNFAGISVTKEMSATTRMVLDSVRTLVIWMVSLGVGWQDFHWLQLVGFVVLIVGMCLYNNILVTRIWYAGRDAYAAQRSYGVLPNEVVVNNRAEDPNGLNA